MSEYMWDGLGLAPESIGCISDAEQAKYFEAQAEVALNVNDSGPSCVIAKTGFCYVCNREGKV